MWHNRQLRAARRADEAERVPNLDILKVGLVSRLRVSTIVRIPLINSIAAIYLESARQTFPAVFTSIAGYSVIPGYMSGVPST